MVEENQKRNMVYIAGRELRVYAWDCLVLFNKYDQIVLSTSEIYKEKTNYLINVLNCLGVIEEKKYKTVFGKRKFEEIKKEVINERTGRREVRTFFEIGLTKVPELFMYTDKDKEIVELNGD